MRSRLPSLLTVLSGLIAGLAAGPLATPARAQAPGGPPPKVTVAKPVVRQIVGALAQQLYQSFSAQGHGGLDFSAIINQYRKDT
ncbi:hypothetical protein OMR07_05505 [Methylobacterium organophilum]|nr:hypothetical protein [Methylobacterium organophilum]